MVALPSMDLKGQTMRYSLAIKRCNQTSIHGQFSLATFDCRKVYYGIFRCIDENSIKYILMRFIHQPEKNIYIHHHLVISCSYDMEAMTHLVP